MSEVVYSLQLSNGKECWVVARRYSEFLRPVCLCSLCWDLRIVPTPRCPRLRHANTCSKKTVRNAHNRTIQLQCFLTPYPLLLAMHAMHPVLITGVCVLPTQKIRDSALEAHSVLRWTDATSNCWSSSTASNSHHFLQRSANQRDFRNGSQCLVILAGAILAESLRGRWSEK